MSELPRNKINTFFFFVAVENLGVARSLSGYPEIIVRVLREHFGVTFEITLEVSWKHSKVTYRSNVGYFWSL